MSRIKNNKGAILIEAILGITIATIIVTALVSALVSSLSNSTFSRSQTLATGYAQQQMEMLRSYKDFDFQDIYDSAPNGGANYHLNPSNPNSGLISGSQSFTDTGSGIRFQRVINLSRNHADCETGSVFAEVSVSWTDSKCSSGNCHRVALRSCFTNVDYVPLP